jgi:hypothetical protein
VTDARDGGATRCAGADPPLIRLGSLRIVSADNYLVVVQRERLHDRMTIRVHSRMGARRHMSWLRHSRANLPHASATSCRSQHLP